MRLTLRGTCFAFLFVLGCGSSHGAADAGTLDSSAPDVATSDGRREASSPIDAGKRESSTRDAGTSDGPHDAASPVDAATPESSTPEAATLDAGSGVGTTTVTYKISLHGTTATSSTSINGETDPSAGGSGFSTVADDYGGVTLSNGSPLASNQYARIKSIVAEGTFGDITGTAMGNNAVGRGFSVYLGNWTAAGGPAHTSSGPSSGTFPSGPAGDGHDGGVLVTVSTNAVAGGNVSSTGAPSSPPASAADYTWPNGYLLTPESTLWIANRASTADSCTFTITMEVVTFAPDAGISTACYEMGEGGYGTIDGTEHVDPVFTVPAGYQAYVIAANTNLQTCDQSVAGSAFGEIVYSMNNTLICGCPIDRAAWDGTCGPEYTDVYGRQNNNCTQQYAANSTAPNNAWLTSQNNTKEPMTQSLGFIVVPAGETINLDYKMFAGDDFIWRVALLVVPTGYVP